jgi:hypothetical protein
LALALQYQPAERLSLKECLPHEQTYVEPGFGALGVMPALLIAIGRPFGLPPL